MKLRDDNRLILPQDYKSQYPAQDSIVPPNSSVYDGDLYYFAVNAEWRKVITGWLSLLTNETYWKTAQVKNHSDKNKYLHSLKVLT